MKACDYCGGQNDDAASRCERCGSRAFVEPEVLKRAVMSRVPESDELPLEAFAENMGNVVALKCRTVEEACLVMQELEKADILTPFPTEEELEAEYERNGCVELRISACAYESAKDLQSAVEFQYKVLRGEQPLLFAGKMAAIFCAVMIVPGLLIFAWLLTSYRSHGYHRRAKEFKAWFFLSLAGWILLILGISIVGPRM